MAIGHITPETLKKMRLHGHPDFWEIAVYGDEENPDSVTVECTKCGEVLVELVASSQEEEEDDDAWLNESEKHGTDTDGALLTPSRGDAVYCQNCDWTGEEADCDPINDLQQRVAPGEPMPAGECPRCGSLCQLKESDGG